MKQVIVRYKVKPERAEENERLIKEVFSALDRNRPAGLAYASYKLEDGVTFVHHAAIDTSEGSNPLAALNAFKAFTQDLKARCDEPPLALAANQIGAYRTP